MPVYCIFFLGLALGLWVIFFASSQAKQKVLWCLKLLLAVKVLLSFCDLLLLFFTRPDRSGRMPIPELRRYSGYIGYFFVGIFLGYIGARWARKAIRVQLEPLIAPVVDDFERLFRLAMSFLFLWSGIVKLLYPALDGRFFAFSGYGDGFLLFIALVEIAGGLGLLLKKTAGIAALLLIADMLGAVFTHFYNHFVRNAPAPFANSLPALFILPFLIAIVVTTRSRPVVGLLR